MWQLLFELYTKKITPNRDDLFSVLGSIFHNEF